MSAPGPKANLVRGPRHWPKSCRRSRTAWPSSGRFRLQTRFSVWRAVSTSDRKRHPGGTNVLPPISRSYRWNGDGMSTFTINGKTHTFNGDPEMPLLWYLRDVVGMTGTKFGCGKALCG